MGNKDGPDVRAKAIGMGGYHKRRPGRSCEWITPRALVDALGEFDLDPCAAITQPWPLAKRAYTIRENGLAQPWEGRVWLNAPYDASLARWLDRMVAHGDGIALIFARTETGLLFTYGWSAADALLFLKKRIRFYLPDGTPGKHTSGAPHVLLAYGRSNADALRRSGLAGALVEGWSVLTDSTTTWRGSPGQARRAS